MRGEGEDGRMGGEAGMGASNTWNIETAIDWKKIVTMYNTTNGRVEEEEEDDNNHHN